MWRYVFTRYLPTYLLGTYLTTFKILGPDLMFAFGFCNFVATLVLFFPRSQFCNFVCCNSFLQSLCLLSCVCSFCFFPSFSYLPQFCCCCWCKFSRFAFCCCCHRRRITAIILLLLLLQFSHGVIFVVVTRFYSGGKSSLP